MPKILFIGLVWPEPNSSAAGSRILQLAELFLTNQWEVAFACAASTSEFGFDLSTLGITCYPIELNADSFDVFILKFQPDVVLFDRFVTEEQYGWRVAEHCPSAVRILDTEDLHFLRFARQQAWKSNRKVVASDFFSDTAKREIASIYRCDLTLLIASFEMRLLMDMFRIPETLLCYIPFLVPELSPQKINNLPTFSERQDFVFIGNFLHEPNWNAVLYLKEKIWPEIRMELPKATLKIYGAYPSAKVLQLHHSKSGFCIEGRAKEANTVIANAKVMLAPLRFGAGMKGKLLEAMLNGTPSITTQIGAESMSEEGLWNGRVTNNVSEMVGAAVDLYTNEAAWLQAQSKGFHILESFFNKEILQSHFWNNLEYIRNNLNSHRQANFIGAILQHHSLQSTKYLSKWIAEKKKL